jgi:hypothetical protein
MKLIIINSTQHHVHRGNDGIKFSLNLATPMGQILLDCGPGDVVLVVHAGPGRATVIEDVYACSTVTSGHMSYHPYGPRFTVTRSVVLAAELVNHGPVFDQEHFAKFLTRTAPNITELRTGVPFANLGDLVDVIIDQRISIHTIHAEADMIRNVNELVGGPHDDAN